MLFNGHVYRRKYESLATILGTISPDIYGFRGSEFSLEDTHNRRKDYPKTEFFDGWHDHLRADILTPGFNHFHTLRELIRDAKTTMQNPEIPHLVTAALKKTNKDQLAKIMTHFGDVDFEKARQHVEYYHRVIWLYETVYKIISPRKIFNSINNKT